MKHLVIVGAGTGGTIVANRLRGRLPREWDLTIVDPEPEHLYQPGLLFLPFGLYDESQLTHPRRRTLGEGLRWVENAVERIDSEQRTVDLAGGGSLPYDLLLIATGTETRPQETPGLLGSGWRKSIFDFYTRDGALALRDALASFSGGNVVVNIVDMPIKCPVAPLEFAFLADDFFRRRGMRDRVELTFATPLDACFTKPVASRALRYLVDDRRIRTEAEFAASEVDAEKKILRSWDGRELPFDLLVTVPLHGGAPVVEASGLGDEMGFVPTDPRSLVARKDDHVFVIGDATDVPTSKAGSVAHFESEIVVENIGRAIAGKSLADEFDGHSNCFIETGRGKALLIDFNYDTEPLPGKYPVPWLGPMNLLGESRVNHWGKLGFRWLYWNALLPGHPLPVPNHMSRAGKRLPETPDCTPQGGERHVAA